MEQPLITFTSDFGTREYYVAAVKGTILSRAANAKIIDVTHQVQSHDLLECSLTVACSYRWFPRTALHLVVVDPEVGSPRRPIVASLGGHRFIAPDNGVLSLAYDREDIEWVIHIEAEHYFQQPVCPTFHARDVFGPVAAALANGIDPKKLGPPIDNFVRLNLPPIQKTSDRTAEGIILHIDKFGNLISNLTPENLSGLFPRQETLSFTVGETTITKAYSYYSEAKNEEIFTLIGSSGFLEIAANKKPAARLLNVRRGTKIKIEAS